ncbi:hypothetical protein CsSME_00047099 [Camellia sinensis var. sinensis]
MLGMLCTEKRSEERLHGVIEYYGMVEAFIKYLMFVENPDSRIIDQSIAYFWQRLSLLVVAESRKARVVPVLGLRNDFVTMIQSSHTGYRLFGRSFAEKGPVVEKLVVGDFHLRDLRMSTPIAEVPVALEI